MTDFGTLYAMLWPYGKREQYHRNFVIIAHIDSGKSTLGGPTFGDHGNGADALHARAISGSAALGARAGDHDQDGAGANEITSTASARDYVLNLIDTPGHSDFSYEVSRALAAVEGAILLIDGTKGIQAQTLSNLRAAQKAGLRSFRR